MSPRFPAFVVERFVVPYALKALPCILVWLVLVWELVSWRGEPALVAKRAGGAA
jgi:hypothetical protein